MKLTHLMNNVLLSLGITGLIVAGFVFGVPHNEEGNHRVQFSLLDHSGQSVTQDDLLGKHLLVFFGFTNCPHTCPVGMAKLTEVVNKLDAAGFAARVTPVFISVDPERDTVEVVNTYLQSFHERFVGLTGTRTALEGATRSFNTYFSAQATAENGDYDVTHSSVAYVIDPDSRVVEYIAFDTSVDTAVGKIKELLL
ncbi:MAG: SCO family protein [Pseudomonadales bacterium]